VPANEFLNLEGDKISTSRNWAVWLHEYLEEFPGKEEGRAALLALVAVSAVVAAFGTGADDITVCEERLRPPRRNTASKSAR